MTQFIYDKFIYAEHPRPDWARNNWFSLDGSWVIEHRRKKQKINVPFPIGSKASGIPEVTDGNFIYSKNFNFPLIQKNKRYFLHIGACDYKTIIFLNGNRIGVHIGGYTSFSFEITDYLQKSGNNLVILVYDSRSKTQIRGKQTYKRKPFSVWYNGVAGIWQSVWIETVGESYIESCKIKPDFNKEKIAFLFHVNHSDDNSDKISSMYIKINITEESGKSYSFITNAISTENRISFSLPFSSISLKLWSPFNPVLYRVTYSLINQRKEILDTVESYFGIRKITWDSKGININGRNVFLKMVLLQGYYPEGKYTPMDYKIVLNDILMVKNMGFNGIRIHQKIESPYFHFLCDRYGLLTTYEMPSFYTYNDKVGRQYKKELYEVFERDGQHPSCILWILFNETWGIHKAYFKWGKTFRFIQSMVKYLRNLDGTRPVIDNSGWEHIDTDIIDIHHYLAYPEEAREFYSRIKENDPDTFYKFSILKVILFYLLNRIDKQSRTIFLSRNIDFKNKSWLVSEYGGFGWYKVNKKGSLTKLIDEYTKDIINSKLFCGYCYTQFYDVEEETNGLLTFERIPKVKIEEIREINSAIDAF